MQDLNKEKRRRIGTVKLLQPSFHFLQMLMILSFAFVISVRFYKDSFSRSRKKRKSKHHFVNLCTFTLKSKVQNPVVL